MSHQLATQQDVIEAARIFVDREYLGDLVSKGRAQQPSNGGGLAQLRILRVDKVIYNRESVHSRMVSLFNTLSRLCDSCFLLIVGSKTQAKLYLGLHSTTATMAENALKAAIVGNLPGTTFTSLDATACAQTLAQVVGRDGRSYSSVVSVSQVPSCRDERPDGMPAQGIEHFIDAMRGHEYTAVIMAQPLDHAAISARRLALENLHGALSPLAKASYGYGTQTSSSQLVGVSESISQGIAASVTAGYSYGASKNSGVSRGHGPSLNTQLGAVGYGFGTQTSSFSGSSTQVTSSRQSSQTTQVSTQRGTSQQLGTAQSASESMSLEQRNTTVTELMARIELQLGRIRDCESYGVWECCAFFAAATADVAQVAAGLYQSLTCGTDSGAERSYVNVWNSVERQAIDQIGQSITMGQMPTFLLDNGEVVSPGTLVSGDELPLLLQLPLHSVSGVGVMEMAAFGRSVCRSSERRQTGPTLRLGTVSHMGYIEDVPVDLDLNGLASHLLVCGTTGVGKSTLISMLLSDLRDQGVHFMVVEPAKGEYRRLLGGVPNVSVFTTHPRKARMLRINPFEFPEGVHVLSHIDRLIEVFSVCWPLYAAQPALLRECVEEAYLVAGWDLANSVFVHGGPARYPDFRTLLSVVPGVIERSRFVGESKGTYEGALLTRIAMLTHGVFGQVFDSAASLSDRELFDANVIVDLSDVGSEETVSLLMGVLIVRLREWRGVSCQPNSVRLRHVMVLEEAHNIFPRTTSTRDEGGETVAGKSVRMLAKCMAEMRGYGQGIIVADQSPGEVDASSIRNTATKIVMRLPEQTDQDAMGGSLSLTDEQRRELARLPGRVALVYQADWTEPVLIQVKESDRRYEAVPDSETSYEDLLQVRGYLARQLLDMERHRYFNAAQIKTAVQSIKGLAPGITLDLIRLFDAYARRCDRGQPSLEDERVRLTFFGDLLRELLACDDLFRLCRLPRAHRDYTRPFARDPRYVSDCQRWRECALAALDHYVDPKMLGKEKRDELLRLLLSSAGSAHGPQVTVYNVLYGRRRDATGHPQRR